MKMTLKRCRQATATSTATSVSQVIKAYADSLWIALTLLAHWQCVRVPACHVPGLNPDFLGSPKCVHWP